MRYRRLALLLAAAVAIMFAGQGIAEWSEPGVLAKETAKFGDDTYELRLKNVNGDLQAQWRRVVWFWENGDQGLSHLGFADQVGTSDPKITVDSPAKRATFEIGTAKVIVRISR